MSTEAVNRSMKDRLFREAYGADWGKSRNATEFWNGIKYRDEKPVEFHGWEWSEDFKRWGALVTFADGWRGYTWPKRAS